MELFGKSINYLETDEWQITENGVYKCVNKQMKYASPIPVIPTAVFMNIDSQVEKIELSFYKHKRWHSVIVPRSTIANKTKIINLADNGLEVNSDNAGMLVKYFADVVSNSLETLPHKPSKSVLGWVDGDFLPYTDSIAFDGEDTYKYLFQAVKSKGTLEEWRDFVKPLREKIEVRLMMSAAFASPLIELIGENPFVLHAFGGTGTAKTVSLLVAMSIFGDPAMGKLTRTMNMTANSMMSTAAFLRNLPFAGDELQTIKSRWSNYDNLIMCITEGVDRGRMSFDKVQETKAWKCSFIFTGEEPCIKPGSGGGVKNRVIEIECNGKLVEHGNLTANFVKTHYGTAGKVYINAVKDYDLNSIYTGYFNMVLEGIDTTDKQAGSMALILTADKISRELFWPEEEELTLEDVSPYVARADEVDVSERAYEFIRDAIAENVNNFIRDEGGEEDTKKRSVWGKIECGNHIYFNNKVLNEVLAKEGYDFGAIRKKWADRGRLERDIKGNLRTMKRINGTLTSCTCIVISEECSDPADELPF